ncbi:PREDICTED: HBS1-like protein isoform X2 [Lepidothrix coronata]|uniref:HBS1-like protein isoform X2 n=1 Tax=Lepidothrix coronata TaxID=321398 RepID=A0A6J0IEM8_9PASS|nr:PREDICTED: HBS1-like protein isoform X2 [Lepidothrix coronata]
MSRHRNVRGYNYDEDFEDDDVYGQSVEDDYCISPSTAAQFIYSRRDKPATFAEPLEEEYGYEGTDDTADYFTSGHQLTEVDRARLNSCLDQMREILAESIPEQAMVQALLDSKFDVQKALDLVLSQGSKQNVKTKNKDAVNLAKNTKGDLHCCPEMCVDTDSVSCAVENFADNTNKPEFGNLTAKSGSALYSLKNITNDKVFLNAEKSDIPSCERKGLKSSSLVQSSSFSDDLCKGSLCELVNKQAEKQLPESANAVSLVPDSVYFSIGSNPSKCKETQDLKSLLMENVVCDSLSPEDNIPLISPNTSDCSSSANFYSPPCLTSALGKLALDNEVSHTVNKKNELLENFSSLVQSRKQESPSSDLAALPVLRPGSTSLADLLQEHQESSASHSYSLADLYTQSTASLTDRKLGTSSLLQLVSQPQISVGMPELTGSLSSLALSKVSPEKEVENLSLSDLIAETIEIDKTQQRMDLPVHSVMEFRPSQGTSIDLSVLVKSEDVSTEQNVVGQSSILSPETKLVKEKQGRCSGFAKINRKTKKGHGLKRQDLSLSWMKALCARPSAFALTLCLRYPPKGYKRHTVGVHKTFLYSRQVQDVKPKETGPIVAITPFDFKSASPDDIVKANQKKAFARQ